MSLELRYLVISNPWQGAAVMDVPDRAGRSPLSYYGSKESSPTAPQHSTRVWINEDRGLGAGCAAGAGGNAG